MRGRAGARYKSERNGVVGDVQDRHGRSIVVSPSEPAGKKPPEPGVLLATLTARARELGSADAFAKAYPSPALLIIGTEASVEAPSSGKRASGSSSFNIVTLDGGSGQSSKTEVRRLTDRVFFVAKRPGNPFPNMISLGRTGSTDVVIALETISKLHGYFLRDGDTWHYTDYQSTNGTVVNGKRVEKDEKRLLKDGDRFKLGVDVAAHFLLPASLYARALGGRR